MRGFLSFARTAAWGLVPCAMSVVWPAQTVVVENVRLQVLTPTLVRISHDTGEGFSPETVADGVSLDFPPCHVSVERGPEGATLVTEAIRLSYTRGEPGGAGSFRLVLPGAENGVEVTNLFGIDTQNLGGVVPDLDRCDGWRRHTSYEPGADARPVMMPRGLLSRRGWTILTLTDGVLRHSDTIPRKASERPSPADAFLFAYGDRYRDALHDLVRLAGKIPMLPRWALGTWYSRFQPLGPEEYRKHVERFRAEQLPLDVVVCDMNWHKDGWHGLRYDEERFPAMIEFLDWAHASGLHVGFNHHPGRVSVEDPRSETFIEALGRSFEKEKRRARRAGGQDLSIPFALDDPAAFALYYETFLAPIIRDGVDFHWVDGEPGTETIAAYYELTEALAGKRTIVLTRQPTADRFRNHRYPIAFSGDTHATWDSLAVNLETTLAGGNNGVMWSHDIGGHMLGPATGELFARWIQLGAMSPVLRLHAYGGTDWNDDPTLVRRPWMWDEAVLVAARVVFQLRYRLMPYLYTATRTTHATGLPLARALYLIYPEQEGAYAYANTEYMLGPDLLVAPILKPAESATGRARRAVWLPPGLWYDYFTGAKARGPATVAVSKGVTRFPLYVRAGAVLTTAPYVPHTGVLPEKPLTLEVYPPDTEVPYRGSTRLYEDDGLSLAYREGVHSRTTIEYAYDPETGHHLTVRPPIGPYDRPMSRNGLRVRFVRTARPGFVVVDGAMLAEVDDGGPDQAVAATPRWWWSPEESAVEIDLPGDRSGQTVTLEMGPEKGKARLPAGPSE